MCDHKYVHLRNDSFYSENGRYSYEYFCIDYFFCEKCLDEQVNKKQIRISNTMLHTLPDWAKSITNKVHGYD